MANIELRITGPLCKVDSLPNAVSFPLQEAIVLHGYTQPKKLLNMDLPLDVIEYNYKMMIGNTRAVP